MSFVQQTSSPNKPNRRYRGLERFFAILALVNFCLVLFDYSYVPWRDFYFHTVPAFTQQYDFFKGIEPHRETEHYLAKVNELEQQVEQTGLQSEETEKLLQELQFLSNEMIEDNPFAEANKTGSLAKIKNQIRARMNEESAHKAFDVFWSTTHLSQQNLQQELDFFGEQIRPLLKTNYYRDINTNGKFIDKFWLIDLPFVILFGCEFIVRTYFISRRRPDLNWLQTILRRWFDVFLLLPFWRWLRIIPLTVHLYQSELVDLEPLREQINHDVVINFAEEMTEIVGIRIIDQAQDAVKRGDVAQWVLHPESRRPYININNTNEVQAIASRLLQLTIYQVLPKIQPDIEALLHHNIKTVFNQSPIYKQLQNVPGVGHLPNQVSENLAKDLSQSLYNTFTTILEDPVAAQLADSLMQNFSKTLEAEVQQQHNVQEIQSLLVDLLEEIKINYVKSIAEDGVEKILDESQQIRKIVRY
ncbi:hypothetical protein [Gloeocapsopsis dulcis]|uniref:Uncharacterized protein n=1 Tax=Gloeocapsopsis dulcis AAB1 = 1H9 TaxID=1433147 RepID=A0A6N8FUL5_9CHRO|nr:hypothetical protein [Gloeocapsopsis dulcis]MUL36793.1 hypothetical protein [Gloeocapsopsis dulcis AAB1 = 1H9]WNN88600.1 hypothetical protein P0S91_20305 [Gloeocapsopsis dulcis]